MDNRLTFGVNRAVWTLAANMDDGVSWHKEVLQGAENFMTFWHKEEEQAQSTTCDQPRQRKQHHGGYRIRLLIDQGEGIPYPGEEQA